jgi:hypothetical protein
MSKAKQTPFQRIWPHLRLVLILCHLLAIGLKALPNTNQYRRASDWDHPSVMAEVKRWSSNLKSIGIDLPPLKLRRLAFQAANNYGNFYLGLVKPFRPYYNYCGTDQQWVLFAAPDRFPPRIELDLFENGEWRPLYVPFEEHRWQSNLLESGRFRSAISRFGIPRFRRQGNRLGLYLAKLAATDFPKARSFRMRWTRRKTPSPSQVRNGEVSPWELDDQTNFTLAEYR